MTEAEKQVLSAWLAKHEYIDELPQVTPEDFKEAATKKLAKIVFDRHCSGKDTDIVELAEALEKVDVTVCPDDGADWFQVLMEWERERVVFTTEKYSKYATEVKENATLRNLYANAVNLADDIRGRKKSFTELVGAAHAITEKLEYTGDNYEVLTLEEAYIGAYTHLAQVAGGGINVIKTGLSALDAATGGMSPGQLTIMAARPGVGKTMLSWFIAENIGNQHNTLFIPLEMTTSELCMRGFTHHLGRPISDYTAKGLDEKTWGKMLAVRQSMRDNRMRIAPRIRTIEQLEYIVRKERPELVTLDYLQLLGTQQRHKSKYEQISEISGRLKLLANGNDCHVLALCQLNREAAKGEPRMDHLRDSGSIEQDADKIILLSQADDDDEDIETCDRPLQRIKVTLDKNRQGGKGELYIIFDYEKMNYYEEAERYEYQKAN